MKILAQIENHARAAGKLEDPAWRERIVALRLDTADLESLYGDFAETVRRGEPLGADVSILKIWATETCQRMSELLVELCGERAPILTADFAEDAASSLDPLSTDAMTPFLDSRSYTIYGGSSEIQRNIVAKNVLGLPAR